MDFLLRIDKERVCLADESDHSGRVYLAELEEKRDLDLDAAYLKISVWPSVYAIV
jgi:hypothetical protein